MEYRVEKSLVRFNAWAGAKDTLNTLIEKGDVDKVESYLEGMFADGGCPTETEINDYLWFESDDIAQYLGYPNWESYERGQKVSEDEMDAWFEEQDFDTCSDMSGMDPIDFADEDSDEDVGETFRNAVDRWWNCLSLQEKIDYYNDYN